MAIRPDFKELNLGGEQTFIKQTEVECKINASTEIKSILAVTGTASSTGEEVVGGEIRYGGRAVFYVLYESADGEISKTECGVEFSDRIDGAENVKGIEYVDLTVQGEESIRINGGSAVRAVVTAEITADCGRAVNSLSDGDNLLCDTVEDVLPAVAAEGRGTLQADEDFELGFKVKDILSHTVSACVTAARCGTDAFILEGFIYLSLSLLQNNEINSIIRETKAFPFALELTAQGVQPDMRAFCRASVAGSSFKVVVDEEKNASTVICSFDLDAFGRAYSDEKILLVKDVYSPTDELKVSFVKYAHKYVSSRYVVTEKVNGQTDLELDNGEEVIAIVGERAAGITPSSDGKTATGIVSAIVISRGENGISGKRAVLPFEVAIGANTPNVRLSANVENLSFSAKDGLEADAALKISVTEYGEREYSLITGVEAVAEKQPNTNAISVYIARSGDTLWQVCKELGTKAESIIELNPDVEFPLTGSERIIVYRGSQQ